MFGFTISQESLKPTPGGGVYDVVIIGGGAAGLTTAIYTSRDGLKTLVLEKEGTGGLAATTEMIENYPGFPEGVNGMELLERFRKQAERFGAEIVEFDEVVKVDPIKKGEVEIHTQSGQVYTAKAVVVATGSQPKKLNLPGEKELYGRGVSYCATCDGPFFKDKNVVIIGAGNSGLQEGLQVLEYAKHVTFLEFLPYARAEQVFERVKATKARCSSTSRSRQSREKRSPASSQSTERPKWKHSIRRTACSSTWGTPHTANSWRIWSRQTNGATSSRITRCARKSRGFTRLETCAPIIPPN